MSARGCLCKALKQMYTGPTTTSPPMVLRWARWHPDGGRPRQPHSTPSICPGQAGSPTAEGQCLYPLRYGAHQFTVDFPQRPKEEEPECLRKPPGSNSCLWTYVLRKEDEIKIRNVDIQHCHQIIAESWSHRIEYSTNVKKMNGFQLFHKNWFFTFKENTKRVIADF